METTNQEKLDPVQKNMNTIANPWRVGYFSALFWLTYNLGHDNYSVAVQISFLGLHAFKE
jgi:hypothetical protein